MPEIGRPITNTKNQFENIGINNEARAKSEENIGKKLNDIVGYKEQQNEFVDRAEHNKMGKDAFLKILAVQLENQDPLDPVDQKKFASELAQFSQLEQLTNMNQKMDKLTEDVPERMKFHGAAFLGREVSSSGNNIQYDGRSERVEVPFFLKQDVEKLMVRIYDDKNQMIKQFEKDAHSAGSHNMIWDGLDGSNRFATKGNYRIEVWGWDKNFERFKADTKTKGVVTGVSFENGQTVLQVDNNKKVFLRDVDNFTLPTDDKNKDLAKDLNKNQVKPVPNPRAESVPQEQMKENAALREAANQAYNQSKGD